MFVISFFVHAYCLKHDSGSNKARSRLSLGWWRAQIHEILKPQKRTCAPLAAITGKCHVRLPSAAPLCKPDWPAGSANTSKGNEFDLDNT